MIGMLRIRRVVGSGLALGALAQPAMAAPVVAGIAARRPASIHPDAERAFLAGAAEAVGVVAPAGPATRSQQQAAVKALEAGEAAYLEFKLKNAETALNQAVEGLLASPGELEDAEPAVRAVLLLAQVLVARRQPDAAELVLERALSTLPGFPRGGQPPPDIQTRIEQVRARMRDRLTASLGVEGEAGAEVRLNGVPMGPVPVRLDRLAPGTVRVTLRRGKQRQDREIQVVAGPQTVRLRFGGPPAGGEALLQALVAGDEASARRAARALQAAEGADEACAAVVVEARAYVLHYRGEALVAQDAPAPGALADWERFGRQCAPGAAGPPADLTDFWREIQGLGEAVPPIESPSEGDGGWAWTALAGSAVAAGAGTWLGLSALDAADNYNRTGATGDEDRARRDALLADVSFTVAVGLVVTGIYFLVAD